MKKVVSLLVAVLCCGISSAAESSKLDFMNSLDNLVEELDNFLPKRELFLWSEVERDELKEFREEIGESGKKKAFGGEIRRYKERQVEKGY